MIEPTACWELPRAGDVAAAGICIGSAAAAMANPANSKRSRRVSDGLAVNRLGSSPATRLVIRVLQNTQIWPRSISPNEMPINPVARELDSARAPQTLHRKKVEVWPRALPQIQ